MNLRDKPKTFWLGVVTFCYSFFLLCQGLWLMTYYLYIYPGIYDVIPGYDYRWIYTMIYFTEVLVLATPILGGLILMGLSYWIIIRGKKSKILWSGLIILIYSFILLFQTIWILFSFPNFYKELYWFATINNYVFINFTIFAEVLGAVVPPLVGSVIFIVIGSYLIKVGMKKQPIANPEVNQIL